jgi:hypothetical protein
MTTEETMTTVTDSPSAPRSSLLGALVVVVVSGLVVGGCTPETAPVPTPPSGENWSVTAWGQRFEVFPEVAPLIAGETATSHTHVTILEGFQPMQSGSVEVVLESSSGDQVFRASTTSTSPPLAPVSSISSSGFPTRRVSR